MKTAVSIPDEVFESAEQLAKRMGQTRSKLYATALNDYLRKHRDDLITQKLNEVYGEIDSSLDPELREMQARSIPREVW